MVIADRKFCSATTDPEIWRCLSGLQAPRFAEVVSGVLTSGLGYLDRLVDGVHYLSPFPGASGLKRRRVTLIAPMASSAAPLQAEKALARPTTQNRGPYHDIHRQGQSL